MAVRSWMKSSRFTPFKLCMGSVFDVSSKSHSMAAFDLKKSMNDE